jgi:protein-L-isoaspartate O-methyltransferase
MSYYTSMNVDLYDYDESIASHPHIDACNASIVYRLIQHLGVECAGKTVLDVGTGTGQVVRLLRGVPGLVVEACDTDSQYNQFFKDHPELKDIPLLNLDPLKDRFSRKYDAIVCRGVYHHIPKIQRPAFLKQLCNLGKVVIISDEGLLEYENDEQRIRHFNSWYSYIVHESKRRKLGKLAEMEHCFWKNEYKSSSDDGGDFKESPGILIDEAFQVGLKPTSLDRFGPWEESKGGFFTATFSS